MAHCWTVLLPAGLHPLSLTAEGLGTAALYFRASSPPAVRETSGMCGGAVRLGSVRGLTGSTTHWG